MVSKWTGINSLISHPAHNDKNSIVPLIGLAILLLACFWPASLNKNVKKRRQLYYIVFRKFYTDWCFLYVFAVLCTSSDGRPAWFGGTGNARWLGQVFSWCCSKPVLYVLIPGSGHGLRVLEPKHFGKKIYIHVSVTETGKFFHEEIRCDPHDAVASWLVRSSPDRTVRVGVLVGDILLCSWALSTQFFK